MCRITGHHLPVTHNVILPITFGEIPVLSLHSTTAPLMAELTVATAVEFNKLPSIITDTLSNVKGPHELVMMGGLWSMTASLQSSGALKDHLVTPVNKLL